VKLGGEMDSFFDSCVIINYLEFFLYKTELRKRCSDYINSNKDFLLCAYALKEIQWFINKRAAQFYEVLKKIKNSSYKIGTDKEARMFNKEEIVYNEELFEELKMFDVKILSERFENEISVMRLNWRIFLKNRIKEFVVKEEEIDQSLINILHEFLTKYADCKILASALQAQRNRDFFLFVTLDKHFKENEYAFIEEEPRLRDYKFPKLKNLLHSNGRTY